MNNKDREKRFFSATYHSDYRDNFQRDYDRVLYSSAFRRLARVTQVVNASEGPVFHNRLTHSLKVSQIGRRLSESILKLYPDNKKEILQMGGLNPEVVATAGLAHDLGNPPFGHAAEAELNILLRNAGTEEGFEGNAQSFRIVNILSCGYLEHYGLNLTCASLNAILKYPWVHESFGENSYKFGVYRTEEKFFQWNRNYLGLSDKVRSLEAEIMDLADDISYAIHDVEDFIKADIIQFYALSKNVPNNDLLETLKKSKETWAPSWNPTNDDDIKDKVKAFFNWVNDFFPFNGPFTGTLEEKARIKRFSSVMITRFIENSKLDFSSSRLVIEKPVCDELLILKALTKIYVTRKPSLLREQLGEANIIRGLFEVFCQTIDIKEKVNIFPRSILDLMDAYKKDNIYGDYIKHRLIADTISSMTDDEATNTYLKFIGVAPGSIFDRQI